MYVLGLDLGTSALKGLVVDQQGELVAEATASYPLSIPAVGFSEQDPKHWLEAGDKVMKELLVQLPALKEKLAGISFSGQMHSLVLLDENNEPLRPAILWNDVRTTKQCQELTEKIGPLVLEHTKNVILEGFTLPKIRWVQENEPEIWQQVKKIQLPKDYLRFWLTGEFHMDYSDAAGTLLLNQDTQEWDQEIMKQLEIDPAIMPTLIASTGVVGKVRAELAEDYGFTQPVQVIAGGADNACAAVGAGIVSEGVGMCSIGTSGVFLRYEKNTQKEYDGKLHVFAHAAKEAAYSMGVTLAAGSSLSWFKDTFAAELSFEELLGEVDSVSPGSDGLLFTPYIVGERTPYSDSQIRGSFIGMDIHHERKHFARSVLEGITFSLKDSQQIMEKVTQEKLSRIVSVGGGAKNKDWLQMQANIFNTPITTLTTEQGPGMGAAMLAAVGCGWYSDVVSCAKDFVSYQGEYLPEPATVKAYEEVYRRYRMVYPATKPICERT
ncbi:xylulokinase [Enterococcus sp. 2201sp1_2201st1_B8_2201SCRN_220225]|uniref:xylulokinase n=1 Tax=unclassified Enterococcus TaxID=2608891 RepID=UPI0034A1C445